LPIPEGILDYYSTGREAGRLAKGIGPLELVRTQELLKRYLPPPPGVILDVGGGPGSYSFWLASLGYAVHLIDVVPLHISSRPGRPRLLRLPLLWQACKWVMPGRSAMRMGPLTL
jgi:hypothetical protein